MPLIPLIAAGLTLALAGGWDLKTGRIPNFITLGSLLLAFIELLIDPGRALASFCGFFALTLIPLLLFYHSKGRGIGGGDIKLLAAVGAWLGPELGLSLTLTALCLAAVTGLSIALYRKRSLKTIQLRLGPYFACSFALLLFFSSVQNPPW